MNVQAGTTCIQNLHRSASFWMSSGGSPKMRVSLACLWCEPQQQSLVPQGFPVRLVRGFSSPLQTTTSARDHPGTKLTPSTAFSYFSVSRRIISDLYQPLQPKLKPKVRKVSY